MTYMPDQHPFPIEDHDHARCLVEALDRAISRSTAQGIKWTPLRERVFLHLARSHRPQSAYDLIESLSADGKQLSPVSMYRVLDVLRGAGLVHRLESRNAFFACLTEHDNEAATIVFHCERCERVAEKDAPAASRMISEAIDAAGFQAKSTICEVQGVCKQCVSASAEFSRC